MKPNCARWPDYDYCLTWVAIFMVALLHGGLYASFLPPWALADEEQHVHYIQYLVEEQAAPVVGQTFLSPEIANGVFEAQRWKTFHWHAPSSPYPQEWGLEGHSYEGYQPPLFYILLAPLYAILPSPILLKVYGLRWAMVSISLLTIWLACKITHKLFPQQPQLPLFVGLSLAMLPERIAAVSRVNNDVLLEVMATAFMWVVTWTMVDGLSVHGAQWLGMLLGLGVLTKASAGLLALLLPLVFWINRAVSNWRQCMLWTFGLTALLVAPFIARNLWLYGDLTGFAGFRALNETFGIFSPPDRTLSNVLSAMGELFRHFWLIWWKGSLVKSNPVLEGVYVILALLSILSTIGLGQSILKQRPLWTQNKETRIFALYALVIGGYAMAILAGYFGGHIPVIQGRFFLPVVTPMIILFCYGLWRMRRGQIVLASGIGVLALSSAFSLVGNLLPYFYYWSAFVNDGIPQPYTPMAWPEKWNLFYQRFLSDKPIELHSMLGWLPILWIMSLTFVCVMVWRQLRDTNYGDINNSHR